MMRKTIGVLVMALLWGAPLYAQFQQTCASYPVIVNTPEDKLRLAVEDADNPQEQVTALVAFLQKNPQSKFAPCAEWDLVRAYVKLKQYPQAIAAGEKAMAGPYHDIVFEENLLEAYMNSGQAPPDAAFQVIASAPAEIKAEATSARPMTMSDADWAKVQQVSQTNAQNETQYMTYAFLDLLSHVTDQQEQIRALNLFSKAYPEVAASATYASQLDDSYMAAYQGLNQMDKVHEYAEKAVTANPKDIEALNFLAFDDSIQEKQKNWSEAETDAKAVISLVPGMPKPAGISDDAFKAEQDKLLGMAHLSLGYTYLVRSSSGPRYATHAQMASAINELELAIEPLASNPALQGGAYFYLGNAYEHEYPAEHGPAIAALEKSAALAGPWQSAARSLLARVRQAIR